MHSCRITLETIMDRLNMSSLFICYALAVAQCTLVVLKS